MEAPPAVALAAFKLMVATPEALVSAVPVEGLRVATAASALKVTTTFGTGAPVALNNVALTVAGVLVVADPVVGSMSATVMLGVPGVVVPPVVPVVVVTPLPPQPTSTKVIAATVKAARDLMWFV